MNFLHSQLNNLNIFWTFLEAIVPFPYWGSWTRVWCSQVTNTHWKFMWVWSYHLVTLMRFSLINVSPNLYHWKVKSGFINTKIHAPYFFYMSVGLVLRYSYHGCLIDLNLSDCCNWQYLQDYLMWLNLHFYICFKLRKWCDASFHNYSFVLKLL